MRVPHEAYQLAGISLLALAAASTLQISGAAACSATAKGGGDPFQATSVTVECSTAGDFQDIDGVFTTRFTGFANSSEVLVNDYDGNGDDIVDIFGGTLTDDAATTPNVGGLPAGGSTSLQPADGTIELLGGNDQFGMFYGDLSGEPFAPNVVANLNTGAGDDEVVIQAGSIQDIDLGDGADSAVISGSGTQVGNVTGGGGNDVISVGILNTKEGVFYSAPTLGVVSGGDGNDIVDIAGGSVEAVDAGAGDDQVSVNRDATVDLDVDGGIGNDTITVGDKATIGGSIFGNEGNDIVNINGGTIGTTTAPGVVDLADGADIFNMTAGQVTGSVFGEGGGNTYDVSGGRIDGSIFAGSQNDNVTISGNASIGIDLGEGGDGTDSVGLEDGDDSFLMTGGTLGGAVSGGAGNDTIDLRGGTINGFIEGNDGDDRIFVSGGVLSDEIIGDLGNDTITISGGTIAGPVSGNEGDDHISISGGTIGTAAVPTQVDLGTGVNIFDMSGGTVNGSVFGEGGGNTYTISGGTITGSLFAGGLNDSVTISGTASIGIDLGEGGDGIDSVGLEDGNDSFLMTGGTLAGAVSGGAGNDTIDLRGGTINGFIEGNDGDDRIFVSGGVLSDEIIGDLGNDTITISGGTIAGPVSGNEGDDHISISGGTIGTAAVPTQVDLGTGVNIFDMSGGTVNGSVFGEGGGNTYTISGGTITGSLFAGGLNDSVTISGTANIQGNALGGSEGIVPGAIELEDGNDTFNMTGGAVGSSVNGGTGNDTLSLLSGSIAGNFNGNAGDDVMSVAGGTIAGNVVGDAGDDQVTVSGGTITGNVTGDDGDDTMAVSGGTIDGNVSGGAGFDQVSVSGGTIKGGIDADHVHLSGGTIGGNITGLGPNTLIIDNVGTVDPLNLADGVLFSGTGANGTVTDTDLAAGGKSQNFTGFDNFSADASTLRFSGGTQGINQLNLGNGSTLFINGNVNMPGSIIATNSLIDMTDGVPDDVLKLGGLTLNGASISLDINQQTLQSDQLVASAFSATGANTIIVNLLGTPQFAQATDIPLIVSASGPIAGTFTVEGIPGTPGSLFTYEVVTGANGGLFLRATPANFGIAAAPTSATNAGAVTVAIDALYGINRDALDSDLNLSPATGGAMVPISSSFGVFASGQFAHTEHDGYDISGGGLNGPGPSFDANDFSAAISLDFNAAKHFQFDKEYGLNVGIFAGYASTDVNLGGFRGFDAIGEGTNKAGMFGGYALFRKNYNYALVSASGFFGGSDVTNGVLGTTGSYDTKGYAVTASVGHIFKLGERTRFDLRGGLLGVSFRGDPYTDSGGNEFGKSRLSFGAIKFEPGIYGDYTLSNGMVLSPYARVELQQRFGYKNTTEIDTREIAFDDADFSAALSTGFNLKVSELTTVSGEVRGKASSDSSTIGAKLGLKIAF
ncbi:autotransporter [Mesorhizobium calcicola]|uniref:Autotransporter n=1 Tax=Mesorhizobium calcicola TaxID=1300310 RepID=A0ABW4WIV7_9HYPH